MKWFYDMKIGKKLIGGFLLVAAIAVTIGLIGYMNIKKLAEQKMPRRRRCSPWRRGSRVSSASVVC